MISGGIDYPPSSASAWQTVLIRAGFERKEIRQFLAHYGAPGYDAETEGELPQADVSVLSSWPRTGPGSGGVPLFTARLMEGLEQWWDSQNHGNAAQGDDEAEATKPTTKAMSTSCVRRWKQSRIAGW